MLEKLIEKPYRVFCVSVLISFLFYGSTLQNDYNFDDEWSVKSIEFNSLSEGITKAFSEPFQKTLDGGYGYRPVTTVSFVLEQFVFGVNPFVSHLINVLLYAILGFYVFRLLYNSLKLSGELALLSMLIFLVLPVHSEVVNSVKNRDELLSMLFAVLFSIYLIKYLNSRQLKSLILSVLFILLGVLAKKSAILFVVFVPFIYAVLHKRSWKILALSVLIPLIGLVLSKGVSKTLQSEKSSKRPHDFIENPLHENKGATERLPVVVNSFGFGLVSMVWIHDFSAYYGYKSIEFTELEFIYTVVTILYLLGLIFLAYFFWFKKRGGELFVFYALTGAFLFPYVNLVTIMPGVVAERWLLIPSLGFVVSMAFVFLFLTRKLEKSKVIFSMIIGVYVISSFVNVNIRNEEWRNLDTLVSKDLETYPENVKLLSIKSSIEYNRGVTVEGNKINVHDLEQVEESNRLLLKAYSVYPDHPVVLKNLAAINTNILNSETLDVASLWWRLNELGVLDSLQVLPNIASLLERDGKSQEAMKIYESLCSRGMNGIAGKKGMQLSFREQNWEAFFAFAGCAYHDETERQQQFKLMIEKLKKESPEKFRSLMDNGAVYSRDAYVKKIYAQHLLLQQDFKKLNPYLEELRKDYPQDMEVFALSGNHQISVGNTELAIRFFEMALAIQPNDNLQRYVTQLKQGYN